MKKVSQIVGFTRSRKPIYGFWMDETIDFPHPANECFTDDDNFDASVVFEILLLRELRKNGKDSSRVDFYYEHFSFHKSIVSSKYEELKSKAGCHDAFATVKLGRQLCNSEFKDF